MVGSRVTATPVTIVFFVTIILESGDPGNVAADQFWQGLEVRLENIEIDWPKLWDYDPLL